VERWQLARHWARAGQYSTAAATLDEAEKLGIPGPMLEANREEWKRRRAEVKSAPNEMLAALRRGKVHTAFEIADSTLALAPASEWLREWREQLWAELRSHEGPPRNFHLWVDGVGGYLLCCSSRVSVGLAQVSHSVDIPISADLTRLHAYFVRDSEGYFLDGIESVHVNERTVERRLLRTNDVVQLGSASFRFTMPVPLSLTARLDRLSPHRLGSSLDAVILCHESCTLGQGPAHIPADSMTTPVRLIRRRDEFSVLCPGPIDVNGHLFEDRAPLSTKNPVSVATTSVRFTMEPIR
jgi:hypothetical protein